MAAATKIEEKIKKTAGLVGLLQAAAWIVMSITCIITYHTYSQPSEGNSYMSHINLLIYNLFLSGTSYGFSGQKMRPNVFTGFMYAYLVLDLIWVSISATILSKKHNRLASFLKLWSLVTALVCVMDLIFVILLGMDYQTCMELETFDLVGLQQSCANGILPVLTIGAKGFVLWIINMIFAIVLVQMARNSKKPRQQLPQESRTQQLEPYNFQPNGIPSQHPRYQAQFLPNENSPYHQHPQSSIPTAPAPQSFGNFERTQYPFGSNQHQEPFVLASPPKRLRF